MAGEEERRVSRQSLFIAEAARFANFCVKSEGDSRNLSRPQVSLIMFTFADSCSRLELAPTGLNLKAAVFHR